MHVGLGWRLLSAAALCTDDPYRAAFCFWVRLLHSRCVLAPEWLQSAVNWHPRLINPWGRTPQWCSWRRIQEGAQIFSLRASRDADLRELKRHVVNKEDSCLRDNGSKGKQLRMKISSQESGLGASDNIPEQN
ncbi:hypothetical protein scyTo_0003818 [Scyliorhinus torazame]|uniref:BRCT domain-containing protein n=1 Tax=Scyliorhinus torazame TaxID=75743 RepID=A0A401PNM3_SCYTO|nr:hypothetical protein [Scyliorhinus torazame]